MGPILGERFEEGRERRAEPQPWESQSRSRSSLPGRSGWFGGAAGLGWLLGGPNPPARPHCSSPGAARVLVRRDVGTRSLGWGRNAPVGYQSQQHGDEERRAAVLQLWWGAELVLGGAGTVVWHPFCCPLVLGTVGTWEGSRWGH